MTDDFAAKINRFMVKIVPEKAERRIRRIAMACYQEIVNASPVDEGTFRANWRVGFGAINRDFDNTLTEKDIAQNTSQAFAMIGSQPNLLGTTIFISNSAPYAVRLENGYSRQAPAGVVGPVIRNIKAAIDAGALQ